MQLRNVTHSLHIYYLKECIEDLAVFQVTICHGFDGNKFSSKAWQEYGEELYPLLEDGDDI